MNTVMPTSKVTAAAVAGALVILLVWVSKTYFGIEIPPTEQAALQTMIMVGVSYWKTENRPTGGAPAEPDEGSGE